MLASPARSASLLALVSFTGCLDGTSPFDTSSDPGPSPGPVAVDPDDATVVRDLRLVMFDGTQLRDSKYGQPVEIAAGGRATLHLRMIQPDGSLTPFGRTYLVVPDTWKGVKLKLVSQDGDDLVLRGMRDPTSNGCCDTEVFVLEDPSSAAILGRFRMIAVPVNHIALPLSEHWLFMPGYTVTAAYSQGETDTVMDETATITGDGITQTAWNQFRIDTMEAGTHVVTARAGDHAPVTLPYTVVAGPDRVVYRDLGFYLATTADAEICFDAWLGDQQVHAPWSFTSSNGPAQPSMAHEGCMVVHPKVKGPLIVTARAGSATISRQFTVAQ